MKLCRFELKADPGTVRSGVYHDGRYYETDGENAIGVHDPGSLSLLAPTGRPPSVRLYQSFTQLDGMSGFTYEYANPSTVFGPGRELDVSASTGPIGVLARVVALVQETPKTTDAIDANVGILGYAPFVQLVDWDEREQAASQGVSAAPSCDFGSALGPFLVTPDDLTEQRSGPDPSQFKFPYSLEVNGETMATGTMDALPPMAALVSHAASRNDLSAGEVIGFPAVEVQAGSGEGLLAADRVSFTVDGLGTLVVRVI